MGHTTHILAIEGRQIRSLAVTRVDEVHGPFFRCVRGFVRRIPFSGFGAGVERGATACVDNESAHEPYPNGNPPPPTPRAARQPLNLAPSVPSARHRYYSWHPCAAIAYPAFDTDSLVCPDLRDVECRNLLPKHQTERFGWAKSIEPLAVRKHGE